MTDREKVINGLVWHMRQIAIGKACYKCPYLRKQPCETTLMTDALALLKEQEPVKPIRLENWWKCPFCSGNIVANMKYCPNCGKAVKWDE